MEVRSPPGVGNNTPSIIMNYCQPPADASSDHEDQFASTPYMTPAK
jgi:hypothetical protein